MAPFPTLALIATMLASSPPFRQPSVMRWGPLGHLVIAEIARDRLSPAVAAETRRLLDGQSITDIASWADQHRSELPNTAPWHYVDIETGDSSYVPSRDCKDNGCVISALDRQIAILGDTNFSDAARAGALKWVVHLVGDIHQPLHAGERGDRGGNDVRLTFNGRLTNLHALWDSGLLLSFGANEAEIVQQINDQISRRHDLASIAGGTPRQWAMESHDIARDVVYRNLPASLDITPAYVDAARPVIYERLLRGGVRLAAILERTLRR